MAERDGIWFEYATTPGRITAVPVSAAGWAVLITTILVPIGICLAIAPAAMAVHPLLLLPVLLAAPFVSIGALLMVVRRKGRRVTP